MTGAEPIVKPTQRGRFFVTLTELKKGKVGVGKEGISCLRLGYQRPEKIAVGGKYKITKKGKIKFATSEQKMVSYDRSLIIGGQKEDGNIGRVS